MKIKQLLSLIFPAVGLVVIPALLLFDFKTWSFNFLITPAFLLPGAALLLAGAALLVQTVWSLSKIGGGVIDPWYPTDDLVISGSYAYTRNPMIGGALLVLAGEALIFESAALLIYLFVFFILNDIYFNYVEEPHLEKRFGDRYREYKNNVPKWLPGKKSFSREKKN